ncbi:MAG: hypothetical protein LC649_07500 [Bacteroidales bacterium]|nr:hypothetical protein [Bacteroidales bacterium]
MTNHSSIIIRKASGETEPFNTNKLKNSLRKAGASEETVNEIAADIASWITDGVTTKKIYDRAFKLFRSMSRSSGYRYRLKEALFEFGPSGYPFERFVGEIFRCDGYEVSVAQVLEGKCVTHEMDVIATRNGTQHLMECKYTHDRGNHLGIQVPLYVKSRVEDIIDKRGKLPEYQDLNFTTWVVTNARFSSDSENYSKCRGINLLGWDYPEGNGLKDMIERLNIFPLTILKNLTRDQKQQLLDKHIVTCRQLSENHKLLTPFNLTKNKLSLLLKELDEITSQS